MLCLSQITVYSSLWSLTAKGDDGALRHIILYFVLYYGVVGNVHTSRIAILISDAINKGDVNNYIVKPILFPVAEFVKIIGIIISKMIIPTILYLIAVFIFDNYLAPASIFNLFLFVVYSVIGVLIWNMILIMLSFSAFWVSEIRFLVVVVDLIFNFLQGGYVPSFMFPALLSEILSFTPIPYLIAFPIEIYRGNVTTEKFIISCIVLLVWSTGIFILAKFLYKKGLRNYEGYGI